MELQFNEDEIPEHLRSFFEPVNVPQLKPKDLMLIPARVALALQADGWYVRSQVIWWKPNAMPESVTDRPTNDYEPVYLLAKSPRYYFDQAAIAEPLADTDRPQRQRAIDIARKAGLTQAHFDAIRAVGITDTGKAQATQTGYGKNDAQVQRLADEAKAVLGGYYREFLSDGTRNRRAVWRIPTESLRDEHYAPMPEALVEPCILAGSAPRACEVCGTPWRRVVERSSEIATSHKGSSFDRGKTGVNGAGRVQAGPRYEKHATDTWQPTCTCPDATGSGVCTVLDPFFGSGTTGRVALKYGRACIGIDKNDTYIDMSERRTDGVQVHMEALL